MVFCMFTSGYQHSTNIFLSFSHPLAGGVGGLGLAAAEALVPRGGVGTSGFSKGRNRRWFQGRVWWFVMICDLWWFIYDDLCWLITHFNGYKSLFGFPVIRRKLMYLSFALSIDRWSWEWNAWCWAPRLAICLMSRVLSSECRHCRCGYFPSWCFHGEIGILLIGHHFFIKFEWDDCFVMFMYPFMVGIHCPCWCSMMFIPWHHHV